MEHLICFTLMLLIFTRQANESQNGEFMRRNYVNIFLLHDNTYMEDMNLHVLGFFFFSLPVKKQNDYEGFGSGVCIYIYAILPSVKMLVGFQ